MIRQLVKGIFIQGLPAAPAVLPNNLDKATEAVLTADTMAIDIQSGPNSATLEARIAVLEELFVRLAQAGATESILDNGFKTISERLETIAQQMMPLRALGPEEPKLTEDQAHRVQNLTAALVSPDPKAKPTPRAQDSAASVQQTRSES